MKNVAVPKAARPLPVPPCQKRRRNQRGFTRLELLVLLATVFGLAVLAAPALGSGRIRSATQACQLNFQELTRAWHMYAEDNQGQLVANTGQSASPPDQNWAWGWLQTVDPTTDNTNTLILEQGQLGKYLRSSRVFQCPADISIAPKTQGMRRVRSVSMNTYMGPRSAPYTTGYRQFRTLASITLPTPQTAFVFIDEHEHSINDSIFEVDMAGFEPDAPEARLIVDYPADRHDGGAVLSFADGHVEEWRWKDPRTRPTHAPGPPLSLGNPSPGNADVRRLQGAASSPDRPASLPSNP